MKKLLIIGGVLMTIGALVLFGTMIFDPFGMQVPKPIQFTPSKPPTPEVLALIDKVKSGSQETRIQAMNNLGALGPDAEAAVPVLIQLLYTANEDLRLNATLTLGKLGKNAGEPLSQTMKDRNQDVRYFSVWALGLLGPDAKDKTADVLALLNDRSDQVRRKAAETLGRIEAQPDVAVPALIKALSDPSGDVRQAASTALTKLGPEAVPALLQAFQDNNPAVKLAALSALGELGHGNPDVLAALKAALLSGDANLASTAASALVKQGRAAIPILTEALASPHASAREQAVSRPGPDRRRGGPGAGRGFEESHRQRPGRGGYRIPDPANFRQAGGAIAC